MLGSLWTAGLFLVNLIKLLIHQSCPSFDVIFALELKVKVWGGSWSQSASAWERGREGGRVLLK